MKKHIYFWLAIIILLPVLFGCAGGEDGVAEKERQKQIQYDTAVRYMRQEKYEEAIAEFASLGDYKDSATCAKYCEALSYCDIGDYLSAYEILIEISSYEGTSQLLKEIYYETRLFEGLNDYKKNLKNPGSLTLVDVQFPYMGDEIDKPSIVARISAQNGFGGYSTSYCWISESDGVYGYLGSCDSLDIDDYTGKADKIMEALTCVGITTLLDGKEQVEDPINIDRVQKIISNGSYGSIKRIKDFTYESIGLSIN